MMNRTLWSALLCLAVTPTVGGLGSRLRADAPASFRVAGAVARPGVWTAARLRHDLAGSVQTISYTLKGEPHTAHAVPLWVLLQAAAPRVNPNIKNHVFQFTVAVWAHDGYAVDFSLGEIAPDGGHAAVWVAWEEDGRPLPEESGPVELVVPGDARPARWVHAVALLTVRDGAAGG